MKPLWMYIYRHDVNEWRWRLVTKGRIMAESGESYTRKAGALRAARRFLYIIRRAPEHDVGWDLERRPISATAKRM